MRRASVAFAILAPWIAACSAALDFELTGGRPAGDADGGGGDARDGAGGSDASQDASADVPVSTGDAAGPYGAPFCDAIGLAFCDGFERADVAGPALSRVLSASGVRLAREPGLVIAQTSSLEMTAQATSTTIGVAAENLATDVNHVVAVDLLLRLDYDASTLGGGRLKLVVIRPFAKIDSAAGAEEAYVYVDASGIGVVVRTFDNPQADLKSPSFALSTGVIHRVTTLVRFDRGGGRIKLDLDNQPVFDTPSTLNTVANATAASSFSVALEASPVGTTAALTARFDNVVITKR